MGLLRRPNTESVVEEWRPTPGDPYEGPHCFLEGFYYPVKNDEHSREIGPDFSTPLLWKESGLVHAHPEEASHFHTHGLNPVELNPGDE